jgi:TonB-dependent starch-binding outer membrane protein SusC
MKKKHTYIVHVFFYYLTSIKMITSRQFMFLLFALLFTISTPVFSQQTKVTGTVTDAETGELLIGVSVVVEGTKLGTITDFNGKFTISVDNPVAVVLTSYIGYTTAKTPIDGKSAINIKMESNQKALEEVVVIGYGSMKRKDLTGSVGKVDIEAMAKAPVTSFDQALGGRVAGVVSTSNDGQPGAASQISIRGSSISQDASPLYVVDGVPIENMDVNSINPNDIESIDVLKDASSIAIYGARGANGVLIITTKQPIISAPRVTYSYSDGCQKAVKTMKMMSPYEYVKLQLELDDKAGKTRYHTMYLDNNKGIDLDSYKNIEGNDWQNSLLRTGRVQNHFISISGGNADTKYTSSGSYLDQKGLIINTGLTRYTGNVNIEQKINKNLRSGLNLKYANTLTYGTIPTAGNGGGVVQGMWQYRPVSGVKNQNLLTSLIDSTAFDDFFDGTTSSLGDNLVNPLAQAENEYRQNTQTASNINVFAEYSFFKNFKFKVSGSYAGNGRNYETFYNSKTQQGLLFTNSNGAIANVNGINGSVSNTTSRNLLNEDLLTYKAKIGSRQTIDALVGFTYQYNDWNSRSFKVLNAPLSTENYGIYNLTSGVASTPNFMGSLSQMYSFLGRINYSVDDKYLLTLSARSDGSSRFTPGKQWGYFPSAAFAWRFSKESFMNNFSSILSDGKLRVSYGEVGNNKVGDFSYLPWAGSPSLKDGYPFDNSYVAGGGLVPYFYGNDNLTWETTKEFDLGLNLAFWNGRISIDADYYNKVSTDFLLSVTLPSLAGYTNGLNQQYQNTGAISNKGFEFTINTVNIESKDFRWSTNFNISFNQNKILSFYEGKESITTAWGLSGGATAWIAKVGGPISQFYGYEADGLYQYRDFDKLPNGTYTLKNGVPTYAASIQPGDMKYKDINHDGVVDINDQITLGSPLPIHTGGLSNTFTYQNFTLDLFFQWSYGNKVLNANKMVFESTGSYFNFSNQFAEYENRWTPTHQDTDIPAARATNPKGDAGTANPRPSSWLIEDGSFIRFKTVSLSYSIPKKVIKKLSINNFTLFVNAQNLYTFTKYSGIDPEVSSYRSANSANSPGESNTGNTASGVGFVYIQPSAGTPVLAQGYDYTPYPRAISFTYGFKIIF